jgi:hypothetical protein
LEVSLWTSEFMRRSSETLRRTDLAGAERGPWRRDGREVEVGDCDGRTKEAVRAEERTGIGGFGDSVREGVMSPLPDWEASGVGSWVEISEEVRFGGELL